MYCRYVSVLYVLSVFQYLYVLYVFGVTVTVMVAGYLAAPAQRVAAGPADESTRPAAAHRGMRSIVGRSGKILRSCSTHILALQSGASVLKY